MQGGARPAVHVAGRGCAAAYEAARVDSPGHAHMPFEQSVTPSSGWLHAAMSANDAV